MPVSSDRYDVVIVGAGHNGLVAAAYLARAGRSCLVLERAGAPGGAAVSTAPFDGVDARLSRYAYLVSLLPAQIVRELGLEISLLRRRVSSYTPDPRAGGRRGLLVDSADEAATAASFRALGAGDGEHRAWQELYGRTARAARVIFPTLTEPLRPPAELRARLDDEDTWEMLFERPLGETLAEAFADEVVRGVVATDALIGTFASLGDASLAQNRCFLYHVIGRGTGEWLLPAGGMGAVTAALERAARAAGAELRCEAEVTGVEPGRDEAAVHFRAAGREVTARAAHVLVNAAPAVLARLLGTPEPAPPEGSQLKVNLLLRRLPRLRDDAVAPELAFAGTAHFNETAGDLERAHREAAAGRIPSPVPCETYCHSLSDPTILGPQLRACGAHTLTVFALHMPARLFAADNENARGQALAATLESIDSLLAEPLADLLLRTPGGEACVEARTPADLEHELAMPGGHIFHAGLQWPFAESEQEVGRWGVETEHPRVLLCGAGARRGGGVSGIPGRNAAMAVLGRPGA